MLTPEFVGDEGPVGDYVLAVESLTKTFENRQSLYRNIDLRVRKGEILVIVGESGIGKSVLLKHLIGLIEPTSGRVWYARPQPDGLPADIPVHRIPEDAMGPLRLEVGMVFQESSLFDWMTVAENIGLPLEEHHDRVLAMVEGFTSNLGAFLRVLDAASSPPEDYLRIREELAPIRDRLTRGVRVLAQALPARSEEASRVALAMGLDRARELGLPAGLPGAAGSPEDLIEALGSSSTLGSLLANIPPGLLAGDLEELRRRSLDVREALTRAYGRVRDRWTPPFDELRGLLMRSALTAAGEEPPDGFDAAALVPMAAARARSAGAAGPDRSIALAWALDRWSGQTGLAGSVPGTPDRAPAGVPDLAAALRRIKHEPRLLADLVEVVPAASRPHHLEAFRSEARAVAAGLGPPPGGPEAETHLLRALVLAWLTTHPIEVDRHLGFTDLLVGTVRALEGRAHEVGEVLAGLPESSHGALVDEVRDASIALAKKQQSLLDALRARTARPGLIRATIDLIVHGLMETFRLVVDRDQNKLPSELSGGMKTRVGMARSLALMPRIVLYDEPTAGLDPVLAKSIAREILTLQTSGVVTTSVVVTHDKELYRVLKAGGLTRLACIRGGVLYDPEGRVLDEGLRPGEGPGKAATLPGPGDAPLDFVREFEPGAGATYGAGPAPEIE